MIIIAGHATRFKKKVYEFPTVLLLEALQQQAESFYYLRHSIDGHFVSQLLVYKNGELSKTFLLPSFPFFSLIRYVSEVLLNLIVVSFLRVLHGQVSFIGVDPLNALSGILLKRMKIISQTIFYAVDYSKTRFAQRNLNDLYLWCDKYAALHSSEVWNISSRIQQLRVEQGVDPKKSFFVPNVPISLPTTLKKIHRFSLITSGVIDQQLDFGNLFRSLKVLRKKYPKLSLQIAGDGPQREQLESLVNEMGLAPYVHFLGYVPHQQLLEIVATSGIGVALYNGNWSFNYYGDSMKCREFLGYGLPVLTTDTHSTAEDIRSAGAGEVTAPTAEAYTVALSKILKLYDDYSSRAVQLAHTYKNIHLRRLKTLHSK